MLIAERANSAGLCEHRTERKHHAIHRNRQQTKLVMQLPDDRNNVVQLLLHSLQLHHYVVNPPATSVVSRCVLGGSVGGGERLLGANTAAAIAGTSAVLKDAKAPRPEPEIGCTPTSSPRKSPDS
jgi:hypothetical protein